MSHHHQKPIIMYIHIAGTVFFAAQPLISQRQHLVVQRVTEPINITILLQLFMFSVVLSCLCDMVKIHTL